MDTPNTTADPFLDSFVIDASADDDDDQRYLVHNRTPHEMRLQLPGATSELRIAPLGERIMRGARLKPYEHHLIGLRQAHLLRVRAHEDQKMRWLSPNLLAGVGLLAIASVMVLVFSTSLRLRTLPAIGPLVLAAAMVVWAMLAAHNRDHHRRKASRAVDREEGDIIFKAGGEFLTGNDLNRSVLGLAVLLGVVAIGGVAPAFAMYYGTDLSDYLNFEGRIVFHEGQESRVISRLIQICYLAVLSLFPALMFFQFDRQRVGSIRGRWVQDIFRLDNDTRSLADVHARYGEELAEASHHSTDTIQPLGGRRSPLFVATILLTLGWTILVLRTDSFDFQAAGQAERAAETALQEADEAAEQAEVVFDENASPVEQATAAAEADAARAAARQAQQELGEIVEAEAAQRAASTSETRSTTTTTAPSVSIVPTDDEIQQEVLQDTVDARLAAEGAERDLAEVTPTSFFQLLNDQPSAAGMAFLGAYFYAVYLVLHGYYRSDLRPKIYNQITARLVVVVVVAYLISVTISPSVPKELVWALAFLAGVMPRTIVLVMTDQVTKLSSRLTGGDREALKERIPLNEIQGISLWERDRLITEGISDLEALAHSNIVATMVRGRLKVERLADWLDQALLLLHLQRDDKGPVAIEALRNVAVRNATTLVKLGESEKHREQIDAALGKQPRNLLIEALKTEPNYHVITQWREASREAAVSGHRTYYDIDGVLQCDWECHPCADA